MLPMFSSRPTIDNNVRNHMKVLLNQTTNISKTIYSGINIKFNIDFWNRVLRQMRIKSFIKVLFIIVLFYCMTLDTTGVNGVISAICSLNCVFVL